MSSDIERWEPPNDATAFESLCLDLWKDIWQDSGAQKNGRHGQWAAGRVTHVDDVVEWRGFALLKKLCPNSSPPAPLPWLRVWLAGEALLEMSLAKATQFDDGPELVTRIRSLLKQLLAQEALTPFELCNWLNATFTPEELKLPGGWKVRLPSEAEWERAARHTDGRNFPWDPKNKTEPASLSNCSETEVRQTSAVGMFPSGQAVCGAVDMAGNVWEWCLTKWREDYKNYEKLADQGQEGDSARVLRGGSWISSAGRARCAFRHGGDPDFRARLFGFRVVASPFFALNSASSEL